jgi:hypothetical protein
MYLDVLGSCEVCEIFCGVFVVCNFRNIFFRQRWTFLQNERILLWAAQNKLVGNMWPYPCLFELVLPKILIGRVFT